MKTVLIAATAVLFCMQLLHAIPMPNGDDAKSESQAGTTSQLQVVSSSGSSRLVVPDGTTSGPVIVKTEKITSTTSSNGSQSGPTFVKSSSSGQESHTGSGGGQVAVASTKTSSTSTGSGVIKIEGGQSGSHTVVKSSSGGQEAHNGSRGGDVDATTTNATSTSSGSDDSKLKDGQNGSAAVVKSSPSGQVSYTGSVGGQVAVASTKTTLTSSGSDDTKIEGGQSGSITAINSSSGGQGTHTSSGGGQVAATTTKTKSTSSGSDDNKVKGVQSGSTVVTSSSVGDEECEENHTDSADGLVKVAITKSTSTSSSSDDSKVKGVQSGSTVVTSSSDGDEECEENHTESADGLVKVAITKSTSTSSSSDNEIEDAQSGSITSSGGHSEHISKESHTDPAGGTTVTTTKTTSTSSGGGGKGKGDDSTGSSRKIDGDDEHNHDNNVGQFDFEITDEQLESLDSEEIIRKSTSVQGSHHNDCEDQKKRLNNDNDQLTRQLKSGNAAIQTLTEEKDWFLTQLEQCRDDNEGISKDFEIISYDVRIVKKKLQKATDNYVKLQTELNKVSSESQSWKSKSEVCSLTLTQTQEINLKYEVTIKEYTTTITTLETTVEQIKAINQNVSTEMDEWKHKYDSEHTNAIAHEETIKNLEATVADLKKKNSDLTDNLLNSQTESYNYSVEINTLETDIDSVKKELSNCTIESAHCSAALQDKIKVYNNEEIQDMEEDLLRGRLEVELEECQSRYNQMEQNYELEKAHLLSCNNGIVLIREDCANTNRNYEEDLENLRITSKGSIDKCEASLKAEVDKNDEILTEIKTLNNQINDVENKLSISIKTTEDANIRSKQYQDETVVLTNTIESLKVIISDTNTQLTTCGTHSVSIQHELNECKSSVDEYTTKLNESEKKSSDDEAKIVQLNGEIETLEAGKETCEAEISTLRCDVTKFLELAKASDEKAHNAALEIVGIYEESKTASLKFVDSHKIRCDDVGENCEECDDEIIFQN